MVAIRFESPFILCSFVIDVIRIADSDFRDLHRSRAFLDVVPGIVDTIADWVEPHLPGIERL
jgi:hypothetical protein